LRLVVQYVAVSREGAMSKKDKREAAIRNNPYNVRFTDLIGWVESEGFRLRTRGATSHQIYTHADYSGKLNFQNVKGMAKGYQVEQAIEAIDEIRAIAVERAAKEKE